MITQKIYTFGISEQAMIDMATGLALEGNKVFVYAMSSFSIFEDFEQAKTGPGLMEIADMFYICWGGFILR